MIGEAITDATDKYITQDYVAATIAEWAKMNYEVTIEPNDIRGMRELQSLENYIKNQARAEAATTITATLGEYMGESDDDAGENWDVKGLAAWAKSRFQVTLNPSEIKQMSEAELEDRLRTAAMEQIDARGVEGLEPFLAKLYPQTQLSQWAMEKFGVEVSPEEIAETERKTRTTPAEAIAELIDARARAAYARREIEYPVDHVLTYAFGGEGGSTDNPYAADHVRLWVKNKYNIELPIDHFRAKDVYQLHEELVKFQEQYLIGGKLSEEIDAMLQGDSSPKALTEKFGDRFGVKVDPADLEIKRVEPGAPEQDEKPKTVRDILLMRARQGAAARRGRGQH